MQNTTELRPAGDFANAFQDFGNRWKERAVGVLVGQAAGSSLVAYVVFSSEMLEQNYSYYSFYMVFTMKHCVVKTFKMVLPKKSGVVSYGCHSSEISSVIRKFYKIRWRINFIFSWRVSGTGCREWENSLRHNERVANNDRSSYSKTAWLPSSYLGPSRLKTH